MSGGTTIQLQPIKMAAERVRQGQLSAELASNCVLACQSIAAEAESFAVRLASDQEWLATLLLRLGSPPKHVLDVWCRQLAKAAAWHEQVHDGQSFPRFQLQDWSVDSKGQLVWRIHPGLEFDGPTDNLSLLSGQRIQDFRCRLGDPVVIAPSEHETQIDVDREVPNRSIAAVGKPNSDGRKHPTKAWKVRACVAAILIVVLVGTTLLLNRLSDPPVAVAESTSHSKSGFETTSPAQKWKPLPNSPVDGAVESQALPSEQELLAGDDSESEIATETLAPDAVDTETVLPGPAEFDLTLDSILPADPSFLSGHPDDPLSDSMPSVPQPSDGATETPPAAKDQQVRILASSCLELPPTKQTEPAVALPVELVAPLTLDFPVAVPLTLRERDTGWQVSDSKSAEILARIQAGPSPTFQWLAAAEQSFLADSLADGRVRDSKGQTLFLRPIIQADPWQLDFDQADVRPSWNLITPVPPQATRIELQWQLPEKTDLAWIEPFPSDQWRRSRAVATLTPEDSETVAIGIRFDVQTGRSLNCRLRFAARLDPSWPWQTVSNSALASYGEHVAGQLAMLDREATRLGKVYDQVGSEGRQVISIQQARVDEQIEFFQTASQRVAELQSLIAALETAGRLRWKVTVQWQDQEQVVFDMPADP